nr:sulfurtransferase [Pseudomonas sp.]
MSIVNIASYRFVGLDDLPELRERILAQALAGELRGTVLLAPEGINLFLAGTADNIQTFLAWLGQDPRFAGLEVKYSYSQTVPFRKMLVKIKREIIRMDHPSIRPEGGRAPAVDAHTLQRWLQNGHDDNGTEVVLVDTRNAFEADAGTFQGALDFRIEKFTQFPAAVMENRDALNGKTIVTFCTGGIRCEKAALYMANAGISNVYQLDGGILKYFEETGGDKYEGECFVFDERIALDPALAPKAGEAADSR